MFRWIYTVISDNIQCLPKTICLASKELKRSYSQSDFGWFWAIAKPLMYIFMFYFAISSGFRNGKDIDGTICPYFIWLASGIVPWQFISDLLVGGATSLNRYKNLIRSTKYPLGAIPMVQIAARFLIHLIMVCVLIVLCITMGVSPSIYWLQLPIYMALTIVFIYLWVLMTSLMNVLSADITEFIKTIRTAFFWLSGILFNSRNRHSPFFTFNPIRFIAEGYRNVFAYHVWIWEQKRLLLDFGIVLIIMTIITFLLYKRMEKRMPELVL